MLSEAIAAADDDAVVSWLVVVVVVALPYQLEAAAWANAAVALISDGSLYFIGLEAVMLVVVDALRPFELMAAPKGDTGCRLCVRADC